MTEEPAQDRPADASPSAADAAAARAAHAPAADARQREVIFDVDDVNVYYGDALAIRDVTLDLNRNEITAFIGPSGCGKSTFIRCLNRMNDLIPAARVEGKVVYHGENLYAKSIDPVQVRKRIGMVFQKPNPFPKSIYDNIAFGPRVMGMKGDMDEIVERALTPRRAVGRGQGPPEDQRLRHVGRPAAAALHRARARHRARRPADGRALLGARPDLHGPHRGPDGASSSRTTRSSSSRTTCSRPRACPT